ncbi:unnamed protein product [Lymnaea stagnalis]|uniref:SH2 domain-containing protein n=1 Tax=Lymnaea stagnalis TaxID=6523 RepID=A0AAV2IAG4_LYMST
MSLTRNPQYPKEILSLSMFHVNIRSREEARDYMKRYHKGEGSYFVRPNSNNDPSFVSITSSITSDGESCHAKVFIAKHNGAYYYFISERLKFSTFNDLLQYYAEHRIHCTQNIDNIRLITPLCVNNNRWHQSRDSDHDGQMMDSSNGIDRYNGPAETGFDPVQNGISSNQRDTLVRLQPLRSAISSPADWLSPGSSRFPINSSGDWPQNSIPESSDMIDNGPVKVIKSRGGAPTAVNAGPQTKAPKPSLKTQHSDTRDTVQHGHASSLARSVSDSRIQKPYANSAAVKKNTKMMIKCMPPAPLPKLEPLPPDNDFYYTHIEVNKNYFQETYQFLKQNELCECGLRLVDSEFPKGWTIHRSHEKQSLNRIFFQQGEDTTWEMPVDLVPLLSRTQVDFILFLCSEGRSPIPRCLLPRLENEYGRHDTGASKSLPQKSPRGSSSSLDSQTNLKQVNDLPTHLRDATQGNRSNRPVNGSQEGDRKGRPVSFDSTPTTVINSVPGSPMLQKFSPQGVFLRKQQEIMHELSQLTQDQDPGSSQSQAMRAPVSRSPNQNSEQMKSSNWSINSPNFNF